MRNLIVDAHLTYSVLGHAVYKSSRLLDRKHGDLCFVFVLCHCIIALLVVLVILLMVCVMFIFTAVLS